jgi:hypothetical protein
MTVRFSEQGVKEFLTAVRQDLLSLAQSVRFESGDEDLRRFRAVSVLGRMAMEASATRGLTGITAEDIDLLKERIGCFQVFDMFNGARRSDLRQEQVDPVQAVSAWHEGLDAVSEVMGS